jgi:hypothetical protein
LTSEAPIAWGSPHGYQEPSELDGEGDPQVGVDVPGTCVKGMAYEMRLVLQGIYQWKDVEVTKKLFGNWCAWVKAMREQTGELLEPMARAARMIEGNMLGILAHYTQGLTTDYMEGLNSLFSGVAQGARVPDGGVHDQHALLRCRETYPTVLLTH